MCIPVGRSQGQESNTIGAPAARAVISAEVKGEGKQPAGLESNSFFICFTRTRGWIAPEERHFEDVEVFRETRGLSEMVCKNAALQMARCCTK